MYDVVELFESVLQRICAEPDLESEWLEMLSQLEYAGCRKIVKSVPFEKVDQSVLNHVMEEASHAFLLKSLVAKRSGNRPWTQCPISELGWTYFQTLDHGVSGFQDEPFHYPAVSWIVEQRVLDVYPKYLAATRNLGVKRVVQRILAQEKRHSTQFGDEGFSPAFKQRAIEWENGLWLDFVSGLDRWLQGCAAPRASRKRESAPAVSRL